MRKMIITVHKMIVTILNILHITTKNILETIRKSLIKKTLMTNKNMRIHKIILLMKVLSTKLKKKNH